MATKKQISLFFSIVLCLSLLTFECLAQEGRIVRETVYSPSLEGNLLGDSPNRPITIYLPPSYDTNPEMVYPVVYLLHGYTGNNELWTGGSYARGIDIKTSMDTWIKAGRIRPMILVMPNGYNKLQGCWYVNSATTGKWADFIARDLVKYIDSHYRTLPQKESRAISGHSMGGYGALKIGMFYPDVFKVMGTMDAWANIDFDVGSRNDIAFLSQRKNFSDFYSFSFEQKIWISLLAALVPNPNNPPFFCDFPWRYNEKNEIVKDDEVYNKLAIQNNPYLIEQRANILRSMKIICITSSTDPTETGLLEGRLLHETLNKNGIKHIYSEIPGNHVSILIPATQINLEAFSEAMAYEMLVNVKPLGKLATTWGQIRREQ